MAPTILDQRYRLDRCLAVGGMGEVWRGKDLALARPIAVKMLRERCARDPEAPARFLAEARSAAKLCHPGIARVFDFNDAGRPFIVMELVDGPSLAVALAGGRIPLWRALDIVAQVARALEAAHSAGVIHRDIKPANLLLAPNGEVKVTDFGIAHSSDSPALTRAGMVLGTPAYLAPERIDGRPATSAADLYALGIVLYECVTGVRPFYGTRLEIALAHRDHPLPLMPASVPAPVRRLVADLTAKDPAARPPAATAVAVRAALLRDQSAGVITDPGPTVSAPSLHPGRGSRSAAHFARDPRRRIGLRDRTLRDVSLPDESKPSTWLKTVRGLRAACL
jgi:eukaryotic-like serine/threonine-protein kinase